jgi:hypothetical protein
MISPEQLELKEAQTRFEAAQQKLREAEAKRLELTRQELARLQSERELRRAAQEEAQHKAEQLFWERKAKREAEAAEQLRKQREEEERLARQAEDLEAKQRARKDAVRKTNEMANQAFLLEQEARRQEAEVAARLKRLEDDTPLEDHETIAPAENAQGGIANVLRGLRINLSASENSYAIAPPVKEVQKVPIEIKAGRIHAVIFASRFREANAFRFNVGTGDSFLVSGIRWKVEKPLHRSWINSQVYLSDDGMHYWMNKVGASDKVDVYIVAADDLASVSEAEKLAMEQEGK